MGFYKLSAVAEELLQDILKAENPVQLLCDRFKGLDHRADEEFRSIIRELRENGYISLNWADNVPYRVVINPSARVYFEQKKEAEERVASTTVIDQSIHIGNGNKFKNVTVGHSKNKDSEEGKRKNIVERHPIITSVVISIVTGLVLMFSFWENIIQWIEGLF